VKRACGWYGGVRLVINAFLVKRGRQMRVKHVLWGSVGSG